MAQKQYRVLGSDIALTRYTGTASTISLASADSWGTVDLRVVPAGEGGLPLGDVADVATVGGRENLAQALVLRLLTPVGSLAPLGHPAFGCRLIELIGGLNNETTRNLARLFTLEALAAEPRVVEVLDLRVEPVAGQPEMLQIVFSVLPLDDDAPLALTLEIAL
jgi:phage baseplate assembly protein W